MWTERELSDSDDSDMLSWTGGGGEKEAQIMGVEMCKRASICGGGEVELKGRAKWRAAPAATAASLERPDRLRPCCAPS